MNRSSHSLQGYPTLHKAIMNFETWFGSSHPQIPLHSADAVLRLVKEGGTVPFIARYRKEQTGNLDEVQIQKVIDAQEKWDEIIKRQTFIVSEIEKQKKLTPELKETVMSTFQLELLEDIYLPYKVKRKTKAANAKEAGLEPLADWIWNCGHGTETPLPGQTLEIWAFTFRNEAKDIKDADAAIQGAQDILIERLAEMQDLRQLVRKTTFDAGVIKTEKGSKAKPHSKFENYFNYFEPISSLLEPQNTHRYLAVRRGWMEEEITLSIGGKPETNEKGETVGDSGFEHLLLTAFENAACTAPDSPGTPILLKAARLAYKAHVKTSIDNEAHKGLREVADEAAINVFAENVRKLLLASPYGPKAVLGVDPGIRTGCKVAVVDDSGKYIASTVIHLQSEGEKAKAATLISEVVKTAAIRAVAVGNGTAGRETETFLRKTLKDAELTGIPVVMVSESGASVYSASEAAREEFPDLDLTVRGAISIARRLQDPLAELVKVDPKSIGVGQYQHDVSEHSLKKSLDLVVDSCVNQVGVNLNTASYHLLSHVAGIGPGLAKAVVERRSHKGLFKSRTELLEVPRFSKTAFEQAAGFLRIPEAQNPLDNTGIHPERYPLLENRAKSLGKSIQELMGAGVSALKKDKEFKEELGAFTFDDIVTELEKPGRDPREEFVPFQYREDIHEVKDLTQGMMCPGIVTNVTNFGAFVDIGVHQDGLVHLSQLADRFVKDPREVVSPGDHVQVRVIEINLEKNQIALSMKGLATGEQRSGAPKRDQEKRRSRPPAQRPHERKEQPRQEYRVNPDGPKIQAAKPSGPLPVPRQAHRGGGDRRPPAAPKQIFNNAFAGLASLKNQLKK
jgi:uncharacterized protein